MYTQHSCTNARPTCDHVDAMLPYVRMRLAMFYRCTNKGIKCMNKLDRRKEREREELVVFPSFNFGPIFIVVLLSGTVQSLALWPLIQLSTPVWYDFQLFENGLMFSTISSFIMLILSLALGTLHILRHGSYFRISHCDNSVLDYLLRARQSSFSWYKAWHLSCLDKLTLSI